MSDNRVPNLREACKFADEQQTLYIMSGLARCPNDSESVYALIADLDAKTNGCGADLYALRIGGFSDNFADKAILRIQNQLPKSGIEFSIEKLI